MISTIFIYLRQEYPRFKIPQDLGGRDELPLMISYPIGVQIMIINP